MNNTLRSALLAALLLSACAAQSPGTAAGPIVDAAAAKDSAADTQLAETTPESDVAGQPGDTASADAAPVDTAAVDAAPTDVATKLPATKGLQPEPLALPAFAHVVDSSGAAVSDQDLLGHYTVLWFYPAAGTSG